MEKSPGRHWTIFRRGSHECSLLLHSPYAFSENKVTTHREMEGLEAFFIHGTISDNTAWTTDVADFIMRELKPYFSTDQTVDQGFRWDEYSGGGMSRNWIYNTQDDRTVAARQLVAYIMKNRKEGQGITLVGHSHGGNVAIQAARMLFEKHHIQVNIVNFNVPAWNGVNDPENPWDNFGIDEMLHFWTDGDRVAGGLAGENKYEGLAGSNVTQIKLNQPLKKDIWGVKQHFVENINWQEVLDKFGTLINGDAGVGGTKENEQTFFRGKKGHGEW